MTKPPVTTRPRHTGSHRAAPRPHRRLLLTALLCAEGAAAIVVLAGQDGSARWQVVRLAAVAVLTVVAAWYAGRAGPAGRGAVALAAGIAGTVMGAGVGSAYAAKAGLSMITVAAVIELLTGIVLLGWGGVALTRALPGWWRLLALPAGLAVALFVLVPLIFAVNVTNRPAAPLESATPASTGLPYRDVTIHTSDGVRLSAWYIPSRNGAAVLLLPGAGSTKSTLLSHASVVAHQGYGALLLDTRGHGRSGGHAMDFGWYGDRDIAAAVSFLQRQPDVHAGKIAVLGLSMGAEQAIVAAGTDPRIRAVVAEGITGEQLADHGWLPNGPDGVIQRGIDWVMFTSAGLLSGATPPMSIRDAAAAAAPRPVLIIAGGGVSDEPTAARWFRAASPSSVQVWVAPGAGHTGALAAHPGEWQARVTGFLDAALNPVSAAARGSEPAAHPATGASP